MASATSAAVEQVTYVSSSGSRVWSRSRTAAPSQATLATPGPVQAPGRIALEVDRDELIAGSTDSFDDRLALFHEAPDLVGLHLDPGHVAVMPDAHLAEPECLERALGGFDLPERF